MNLVSMTYWAQMFFVLSVWVFLSNCLVLSTTKKPSTKYRRDYVYFQEFDSFIKINSKRKSWHEAKAYCEAEGASLAVIRTSNEASAILSIYPQGADEIWIGLQDLVAEGEFQTIDGQPIAEVFGEWGTGEPNDWRGDEDCVTFTSKGKLNDRRCSSKRSFLCKKDAFSVTPNADCDNFDLGYKPVLGGSECIKFHETPKNWEEAYTICTAEEAHLAIINSQEEADIFISEMEKHTPESLNGKFNKKLLLLGFHDKIEQGQYVTVDGLKLSESGYERWAKNQPDNSNRNERCGSMFRDGTLNDVNCATKASFICEMSLVDPFDVFLDSRNQSR